MQHRHELNFFSTTHSAPNLLNAALTIQIAKKDDLNDIIFIAKKTYQETHPGLFSEERLNQIFGDKFTKQFEQENCFIIMAKINQKIIGYGKLIIEEKNIALLDKLYVLKDYQGMGCGSSLLNSLYQTAFDHGCSTMTLQVVTRNKKAILFYQKNGFIVEQENQPCYFSDGKFSGDYLNTMVCNNIKEHLLIKSNKQTNN